MTTGIKKLAAQIDKQWQAAAKRQGKIMEGASKAAAELGWVPGYKKPVER